MNRHTRGQDAVMRGFPTNDNDNCQQNQATQTGPGVQPHPTCPYTNEHALKAAMGDAAYRSKEEIDQDGKYRRSFEECVNDSTYLQQVLHDTQPIGRHLNTTQEHHLDQDHTNTVNRMASRNQEH